LEKIDIDNFFKQSSLLKTNSLRKYFITIRTLCSKC